MPLDLADTLAHAAVPDAFRPGWPAAAALAPIALGGAAYGYGLRRLWARAGRGRGVSAARATAFAGGLAVLAVALAPPLDAAAHARFAAHMLQHLLLVVLAAPLLALGAPLLPLLFAAPRRARHRIGAAAARGRAVAGLPGFAAAAVAVHAAVLWLWHAPPLYDAALASRALHALEHATLLASALLLWAAIVGSGRALGHGAAILVVFASALQSGGLGALLTFTRSPLYSAHAGASAARGVDPLADQQLAGVLMWVPGGLVYAAAALAVVLSGLRAVERRAVRRELGESR